MEEYEPDLKLMLFQSLEREAAWEKALRDLSKLGDAQFFRIYHGMIDEANERGLKRYLEERDDAK